MKVALVGAALAVAAVSAHAPSRRSRHRMAARSTPSISGIAYWGLQNGNEGSCGQVHNDSTVLAGLAPSQYGPIDQVSALCGKSINVTNNANGKEVTALVTDSCASCPSGSIYLSIAAFEQIGDLSVGVLNVTWSFSDGSTIPELAAATPTSTSTTSNAADPPPAAAPGTSAGAAPASSSPTTDNSGSGGDNSNSPPASQQQEQEAAVQSPAAQVPSTSGSGGGTSSASSANGWNAGACYTGGDIFSFMSADTSDGCQGPCYAADLSSGLGYTSGNSAVFTVQSGNMNGGNRGTLRMVSNMNFNQGSLIIVDIAEMPATCGHWPSMWMTSTTTSWPQGGEIDIIEYSNLYTQNTMSVHTGGSCTSDSFYGVASINSAGGSTTDCNANDNPDGCAYNSGYANSVGPNFNAAGGGTFALVWASYGIEIFFWPAGSVPGDVSSGSPNPSSWSSPDYAISSSTCDTGSDNFKDMALIFTDQLGGVFSADLWDNGAAGDATGTCSSVTSIDSAYDYVTGAGDGIANTFWSINSICYWTQ